MRGFIRLLIVAIGFLLQIALGMFTFIYLGSRYPAFEVIYTLVGVFIALTLIKNSKSLSNDLPWIIIIILFPIVGGILYLLISGSTIRSRLLWKTADKIKEGEKLLAQEDDVTFEIEETTNTQLRYIHNSLHFPVYRNNDITYYPSGEECFPVMLRELEKAEKFIFLEYFIITPGRMWESILKILKQKAEQGVDVRVMYDDFGCLNSLPDDYPEQLKARGIQCVAFNKMGSFRGAIMNNRDHRKILVIDGKTAFSGGINLADEYINEKERFGYWKDNGIMVKGESVWSFTVMFLELWNACVETDMDFTVYKNNEPLNGNYPCGLVAPYGDTPLDEEPAGENVYLNIINQAKKYVYIMTPYLIIDNDVVNSLILAAKRGVDVRMILPGIPDKKIVYQVTKSYFEMLSEAGVNVLIYKPGFVHGKVFVCDDKIATVGTINLDYRSLYLHFECGLYIYDHLVVMDVKKDFLDTERSCHLLTTEETDTNFFKSLFYSIMRLFAPLM